MGSDDQSLVKGKGKRTKRPRSSSPFGLAPTMTDSSSSGSAVRGWGGGGGDVIEDYNSISSRTTSEEIYESTEEEEDMANCLIMLAQGDGRPKQIQENMNCEIKIEKLRNPPKFSNKAGFYVYECKTCNRSFPSFQALGGHRASHKKPKATSAEEKKSSKIAVVLLKNDYSEEFQQFNKTSPPPPLSVQAVANNNSKANKIHECSICGSEFTSGQALGGHMRRHRAAAAAAASTANNNSTADAINNINLDADASNSNNIFDEMKPAASRSILPLDLNLPAPEDHEHPLRDSKFQFGSTQQALVFSAPALVDCHY